MSKILLVEDDQNYADLVCDCLGLNHTIEVSGTVARALEFIAVYSYELLIVDWQLPDAEGPVLINELRTRGLTVPILMLTARDTLDDKERGFDVGADDYLAKSADPRELLVRVRALLRRPGSYKDETFRICNDVEIDVARREVRKKNVQIHMLPKEFAILEFMARNPNRIFSAEELLERIWPSDSEASSHTVRATINRIRTKLDEPDAPSIIQTKYKAGYQLMTDRQDK